MKLYKTKKRSHGGKLKKLTHKDRAKKVAHDDRTGRQERLFVKNKVIPGGKEK